MLSSNNKAPLNKFSSFSMNTRMVKSESENWEKKAEKHAQEAKNSLVTCWIPPKQKRENVKVEKRKTFK